MRKTAKRICGMEKSREVNPQGFSYKTVLLGWAQHDDGAATAEEILHFLEHHVWKERVHPTNSVTML